ncbi:MAG TPA: hypothetical protein VE197_20885, partial [Mycobacterium sp.]|nr:hypothetical protein [Mycobacterium sp.]
RHSAHIVTGLVWIVRFLLAPFGAHRHRTGLDCPVPPRAIRRTSSPDWDLPVRVPRLVGTRTYTRLA